MYQRLCASREKMSSHFVTRHYRQSYTYLLRRIKISAFHYLILPVLLLGIPPFIFETAHGSSSAFSSGGAVID
uniref:Uncharacterized protein n=1 Tax=Parascaris univalens TaxID=6257 RepID=A0A915BW05_PARUN